MVVIQDPNQVWSLTEEWARAGAAFTKWKENTSGVLTFEPLWPGVPDSPCEPCRGEEEIDGTLKTRQAHFATYRRDIDKRCALNTNSSGNIINVPYSSRESGTVSFTDVTTF